MKNSCAYCPVKEKDQEKDCPCVTPYENKFVTNNTPVSFSNSIPLSFPKWEATGEYIENNISKPIYKNKKNSIVLLKDSKFIIKIKKDGETYINTLYEDTPLNINGRIRTKFGSTFAVIRNEEGNEEANIDASISIIEPIIYYNGIGLKSVGKYNIDLIDTDSKIRVAKGQIIEFDGNVKVTLVDDLVLDFVAVLSPQQKTVEILEKKVETEVTKDEESIQEKVVVPENNVSINNIERTVLSPQSHQKVILTRELFAKLT